MSLHKFPELYLTDKTPKYLQLTMVAFEAVNQKKKKRTPIVEFQFRKDNLGNKGFSRTDEPLLAEGVYLLYLQINISVKHLSLSCSHCGYLTALDIAIISHYYRFRQF